MSILVCFIWESPHPGLQAETGRRSEKRSKTQCIRGLCFCLVSITYVLVALSLVFLFHLESWVSKPLRKLHYIMEVSKGRSVLSPVVFSSIFLSVICFAGLIHVEMELHVQRQMLQVLNRQREGELELRNTPHEDKESLVKMSHSDTEKGT